MSWYNHSFYDDDDFPVRNLSSLAIGLEHDDTVNFLKVLANWSLKSNTFEKTFEIRQYDYCNVISFRNIEWSMDNMDATWLMRHMELLHTVGRKAAFLQISSDSYTEWACNGGERMMRRCCKLDKKNCCIEFKPPAFKHYD